MGNGCDDIHVQPQCHGEGGNRQLLRLAGQPSLIDNLWSNQISCLKNKVDGSWGKMDRLCSGLCKHVHLHIGAPPQTCTPFFVGSTILLLVIQRVSSS